MFEWINKYYGTNYEAGQRVKVNGNLGTIINAIGPHLGIKLDGSENVIPYHPTWNIKPTTQDT